MNRRSLIKSLPVLFIATAVIFGNGIASADERDRDEHRGRWSNDHELHKAHHRERRDHHDHKRDRRHGCFECRIDRRQERQSKRIRHGVRSGELTRWETKKLRKQQRRIARMERRFTADGRVTRKERKRLVRALDRASDRIAEAKHNDLFRRWHGYGHRYDHDHREKSWYFDRL